MIFTISFSFLFFFKKSERKSGPKQIVHYITLKQLGDFFTWARFQTRRPKTFWNVCTKNGRKIADKNNRAKKKFKRMSKREGERGRPNEGGRGEKKKPTRESTIELPFVASPEQRGKYSFFSQNLHSFYIYLTSGYYFLFISHSRFAFCCVSINFILISCLVL